MSIFVFGHQRRILTRVLPIEILIFKWNDRLFRYVGHVYTSYHLEFHWPEMCLFVLYMWSLDSWSCAGFFSIFNALFSFAYMFYAHQSFDFVIKRPWAMKPRAVNPGIFSSLAAPRLSATYENKGVMTIFSKKLSFFRLSNLMSLASWQLSVFKEESDIWLYFVRCNKNSQFYLLQPYPIDILNRDKAR